VSKLSRTEQIIAEKTVCVLLVRGESPDGGKIYAYVAVRADKLEDFMEAQRKGLFYPEEYGMILASGESEPDAATRERMTTEYGFNHQAMMDIPDASKAHDIASDLKSYDALKPKKDEE
jgi:hypothetical protein